MQFILRHKTNFIFLKYVYRMLSILIPVYNYDVRDLVRGLREQTLQASIDFEIVCLDDASDDRFREANRVLGEWQGITYEELPTNIGRSKIRNVLAEKARFEHLLFMDCDSGIVREDYIQTYLDTLAPDRLLYGGRVYVESPPVQQEFYLHWLFGRNREQKSASERQKQPYHAFMTNNFLIPKAVFQQIGFDERLTQYGHEDTLFGMELQKRNIPILHLENPLQHECLESAASFLEKTGKGIQNLYWLHRQGTGIQTRLLAAFLKLEKWKIDRIVYQLLKPFSGLFRKILLGKPRSLFWFDLYKLYLLAEQKNNFIKLPPE